MAYNVKAKFAEKDILVTQNSQSSAKTDFRGRKRSPRDANIKHEVLYAGLILPFSDQIFLTGLAGGAG